MFERMCNRTVTYRARSARPPNGTSDVFQPWRGVFHATNNPAYRVACATAGLLVFLYLFSQLLLFGAAWAATGTRGRVVDLAAGPPPPPDDR